MLPLGINSFLDTDALNSRKTKTFNLDYFSLYNSIHANVINNVATDVIVVVVVVVFFIFY